MNKPERRRFSRVDFTAQVALTQGSLTCAAELIDISLKGLLLRIPADTPLDPGQPLQASVYLAADLPITMNASIVHHAGEQLGLTCDLIDIESMSHLRRLIELNLGDPAAAERELHELIGTTSG